MSFNRDDYVAIKKRFDSKRGDAERIAKERTKDLCGKIPELKKVCDILSDTGPRVYAAALEGKEEFDKKFEDIKRENDALLQRKREILTENGYPADYLEVKYSCPLCRDEGNVNGRMCECMKKELVIAGYSSAGIAGLCGRMNFDTFDLSYYEGAERKNMEIVLQKCREYAENFRDTGSGSLLFFGGTGLGKTHLSVAMAKRVIEGGHTCVYTTADDLFSDFRKYRFDNSDDAETDKYSECELLIIDDLGTELNGRDIVPFLYNLLNQRLNAGRSTLISTNLSNNRLLETYDERIVSRLFGEFLTFRFTGKDIRMQKLKKQL